MMGMVLSGWRDWVEPGAIYPSGSWEEKRVGTEEEEEWTKRAGVEELRVIPRERF